MSSAKLIGAVIALVLIGIGGTASSVGPWYRALKKPRWCPPDWAFGPAWTIIISVSACAGVIGWEHATIAEDRDRILILYAVAIALHLAWSPLFFNLQRPDWALMEIPFLAASIIAVIIGMAPISDLASLLMLPYLSWLCFATALNWSIVRLNRPFTGKTKLI